MRRSPASHRNRQLGDWTAWAAKKKNLTFFAEALRVMGEEYGLGKGGRMTIGLVGSRDLPGVILRRAQSVLRWDQRPSLWSHVFLIGDAWDGSANIRDLPILEVPLFPRTGSFPRPEQNGLSTASTLGLYADSKLDANVALIAVARRGDGGDGGIKLREIEDAEVQAVSERAKDPNYDRLRYDLWDSLGAWNRYLWSHGEGTNPLRQGVPVPASAYVEMAFEAMRVDLVPGASERNSAPEHLWNAAVWWHQQDKGAILDDSPYVMTGCFALRDPGCAMLSADD